MLSSTSKKTNIAEIIYNRTVGAEAGHTGYIEVFMQGKCGRDTETTFELKRRFGIHGN